MRKHEKNIGKKVYYVRDGYTMGFSQYEIYEGILVNVSDNYAKIYIEELEQVINVSIRAFNHTGNVRFIGYSWGYNTKNLYDFIEQNKNRMKKMLCNRETKKITSYSISKDFPSGNVPWDYLEININNNQYLHRYKKELEKLFNYFSKKRNFLVKNTNNDKYEPDTSIGFYIIKYYQTDKTKPFKVKIEFCHQDGFINIHKFDKFIKSYELIEGEKYNG